MFLIIRILCLFLLSVVYAEEASVPAESELLPSTHPLHQQLESLCTDPHQFHSWESCVDRGFIIKNEPLSIRPWSVMVLAHPSLSTGYVIKKYSAQVDKRGQLDNFLRRVRGARMIAEYIKLKQFNYLTVPQKWLYPLPAVYNDAEGNPDYLLICEELDVISGSYFEGKNSQLYQQMALPMVMELGRALYDLCGCDAWPHNLPFTTGGKLAFIDTEHLGLSPGDFPARIVPYLNSAFQETALVFWQILERQERPWLIQKIEQDQQQATLSD